MRGDQVHCAVVIDVAADCVKTRRVAGQPCLRLYSGECPVSVVTPHHAARTSEGKREVLLERFGIYLLLFLFHVGLNPKNRLVSNHGIGGADVQIQVAIVVVVQECEAI